MVQGEEVSEEVLRMDEILSVGGRHTVTGIIPIAVIYSYINSG
jgi:hypothetical protein